MKYFNGFSLKNEEILFKAYLIDSDLCVSGFSYGAQQALEYTYHSTERIDRLILLSPAFFHMQKPSFVRTQLRYFEEDNDAYVIQFLKNISYPSAIDLSDYLNVGIKEELNVLLNYQWEYDKIKTILERGTVIEVFLGSKDKIIDPKAAFDFFSKVTKTYYIKDVGHALLKEGS